MNEKNKYIYLALFLIGGITGILFINTHFEFVHGLILYISPSIRWLYINAFWSYGLLSIVTFALLKTRWRFLARVSAIAFLFIIFFALNYFFSTHFFEGLSDALQQHLAERRQID